MFGTLSHPKKPKLRSRPVPKIIDVQGPQPDLVGHVRNVRLLVYTSNL